jgi:hypothetical protein
MRYVWWAVVGVLSLTSLSGCRGKPRLTGGGSSFINPLMVVWAGEYAKTGVQVDYTSSLPPAIMLASQDRPRHVCLMQTCSAQPRPTQVGQPQVGLP